LAVDRFLAEVARPVAASREHATRAADIRARHYHWRDRDLSLADCFVIAAARPGDAVATSDSAVAHVARAEGLDVLALPNARGRRP
jgi:rRNA-processing protein FCF1